jgi:hypothetical protein
LGEQTSDLATLHQGIDVALDLSLLQAVLRHDLRNDIVLTLEGGKILLGKLAPLRPDFLENDLLGLGGGVGFRSGCIGS